jgi:hypothetical protein
MANRETRRQKEPFHVYTELVALRDYLQGGIFTVTNETLSASGQQ